MPHQSVAFNARQAGVLMHAPCALLAWLCVPLTPRDQPTGADIRGAAGVRHQAARAAPRRHQQAARQPEP
jgi:hypothetical protein